MVLLLQVLLMTLLKKLFTGNNTFFVPSGRIGKESVLELSRLYQAYTNSTTLHSVALTACFIFQVLVTAAWLIPLIV